MYPVPVYGVHVLYALLGIFIWCDVFMCVCAIVHRHRLSPVSPLSLSYGFALIYNPKWYSCENGSMLKRVHNNSMDELTVFRFSFPLRIALQWKTIYCFLCCLLPFYYSSSDKFCICELFGVCVANAIVTYIRCHCVVSNKSLSFNVFIFRFSYRFVSLSLSLCLLAIAALQKKQRERNGMQRNSQENAVVVCDVVRIVRRWRMHHYAILQRKRTKKQREISSCSWVNSGYFVGKCKMTEERKECYSKQLERRRGAWKRMGEWIPTDRTTKPKPIVRVYIVRNFQTIYLGSSGRMLEGIL